MNCYFNLLECKCTYLQIFPAYSVLHLYKSKCLKFLFAYFLTLEYDLLYMLKTNFIHVPIIS